MFPRSRKVYCEMCGAEIDEREARRIVVDGVTLVVCPRCYEKLVKRGRVSGVTMSAAGRPRPLAPTATSTPLHQAAPRTVRTVRPAGYATQRKQGIARRGTRSSRLLESYEVVEDYAERIRRARMRLGWSQKVLAIKVRESENTIKRIEAGKLRPTIELARRLEEVLGIKLLEPAVDKLISGGEGGRLPGLYATLGEIVNIRKKEGE